MAASWSLMHLALRVVLAMCVVSLPLVVMAQSQPVTTVIDVDLPAQPMDAALKQLAEKHKLQLVFSTNDVKGLRSPEVKGRLSIDAVMQKLTAGTNLHYQFNGSDTIVVKASGGLTQNPTQLAQAIPAAGASQDSRPDQSPQTLAQSAKEPLVRGMPQILVNASRSLNVDIMRTQDDSQPYVVFDRSQIASSGAISVEEFILKNLPMSAAPGNGTRQTGRREITLRGLGADETLVLINGRRLVRPRLQSDSTQTDLNGIPLEAVERIEVLPTTASGIYGANATGGVVNVILKQDYNGVSVSATYGSTTRGDGSISQLQVAGGTSFERTSFIFTGSIEELGAVELGKRDFLQTAREQLLRNNPAALPVGGVIGPYGLTPNFRSANGSPLYGPNTPNFGSVPSGYLGNGVQGLLPGAGTYSLGIHNSANVLGGGRYQIEPETRKRGLMSSVTHELSGDIRLFGEVIASQNTVTNFGGPSPFFTLPPGVPGNPFPTLVFVTVPTSSIDTKSITENTMWSGVFGGTFRLWRDWTGNLEAGISRYTIKLTSAPTSFLPSLNSAIASGSINVFRDTTLNTIDLSAYLAPRPELTPFTQTTRNASLRLGGPVLSMPAGPLVLTSLVETQREKSDDGLLKTSTSQTLFPGVSQTTESAYVEATIPLVGNRFRAPGEAALEAQVAGRYDRFETDTAPSGPVTTPVIRTKASDSSVNPTVSIRYQPMQGLAMRASYARGFLPPAAGQLVQMATTTPTTLADPRRGGETVALPAGTVLTGGNPSLGPERSSSSSIGVILTPPAVPQLRLSIDYTKIDKTDNIEALGSARLLANEDLFPGRISRTSPQANDPFGVGRIVALDVSNVNVSSAKISAVDLKASYSHNLGSGFVDLDGLMTWQRQYDTQLVPAAPVIDRVSLSGQNNPLRFRGNIAVQWRTQAYRVKLDTRYRDSYRLDTSLASNGPFFNYALSNGGQRVASRTYNDLFAAARLPKEFPLGEAELSLYVTNLFDIKPRFDPSEGTAYLVSPYDDLRLRSIRVSIRMTF